MDGSGIYDEVDSWQRETILWACSVDVSEVDAKSPLAVCFFDEHDVGQPFWVLHLSDCPAWKSLSTSSLIAFFPLQSEAPSFLIDWFEGRVDA